MDCYRLNCPAVYAAFIFSVKKRNKSLDEGLNAVSKLYSHAV